jgi:hypothetical protein
MSKSLQEQLLGVGLANKKQAKKISQAKHKKRKARGKKPPPPDAIKEKILQEAAQKARRDRELNREREELAASRAQRSQISQLIDTHAVERKDAEIVHRFVYDGKVKQIYVLKEQQAQLAAGKLRIVFDRRNFHLVDPSGADKIALRDPSAVVPLPETANETQDDDYAGYEVPDDLMW